MAQRQHLATAPCVAPPTSSTRCPGPTLAKASSGGRTFASILKQCSIGLARSPSAVSPFGRSARISFWRWGIYCLRWLRRSGRPYGAP